MCPYLGGNGGERGAAGGPWLQGNPGRKEGGGGVTAQLKPVQRGSPEAGADRHLKGQGKSSGGPGWGSLTLSHSGTQELSQRVRPEKGYFDLEMMVSLGTFGE